MRKIPWHSALNCKFRFYDWIPRFRPCFLHRRNHRALHLARFHVNSTFRNIFTEKNVDVFNSYFTRCVCVCVYIYIYIYTHTHTHTHIYRHTWKVQNFSYARKGWFCLVKNMVKKYYYKCEILQIKIIVFYLKYIYIYIYIYIYCKV